MAAIDNKGKDEDNFFLVLPCNRVGPGRKGNMVRLVWEALAMKQFIHGQHWIILFTVFIFAPLVWIASDRSPPYHLTGGFSVPEKIVRGETYHIDWNITNFPKTCEGTTYRFIVDASGKIWTLPPVPSVFGHINVMVGQSKVAVVGYPRVMEKDTALGRVMFGGENVFYCNFIQRWIWPLVVIYTPVYSTVIDAPAK